MVSMVGAGLLTVGQAIYMIMGNIKPLSGSLVVFFYSQAYLGANIGTSVTSTLVAFGNAAEKDEFARAMTRVVELKSRMLYSKIFR